jgi:hypothetical protein
MMRRSGIIFVAACVVAAGALAGQEPTRASRGISARVEVEYGPLLRARSEQSPTSPILVRVAPQKGGKRQQIEFIGAVAGTFDLRDFLEREDGAPLADLPAIPVSIESKLPPGHGTDLYDSEESWFNWRAHYRELMWGAVGLWALAPVVYLIVRRARTPAAAAPVAPPAPALTIGEQLREAIESAGSRVLSVDERAKLELLVIRYFSDRIAVDAAGDPARTLGRLREHPESSGLVIAIERWLHARASGDEARAQASAALQELRATRLRPGMQSAGVGA